MTLFPGNVVNPLDPFKGQGMLTSFKKIEHQAMAYAKIGIQTQTSWDLWIPSRHPETPDRPLIIPGNAKSSVYITFIGMRVSDADILGTAGEKLKIADSVSGAGFSGFNNVFDVDNTSKLKISPDLALISDGYGIAQLPGADASLPAPLGEMPGWSPKLFNVTAGGTALGNGMKSADPKKDAIIIVDIVWSTIDQLVISKEALLKGSWSS